MPAGKDRKAITLSFSKKNEDVADLLEGFKSNVKGFNQNDYVCEAIRFYNTNKDKLLGNLSKEEILKLIDDRILQLRKEFSKDYPVEAPAVVNIKQQIEALDDDDLSED